MNSLHTHHQERQPASLLSLKARDLLEEPLRRDLLRGCRRTLSILMEITEELCDDEAEARRDAERYRAVRRIEDRYQYASIDELTYQTKKALQLSETDHETALRNVLAIDGIIGLDQIRAKLQGEHAAIIEDSRECIENLRTYHFSLDELLTEQVEIPDAQPQARYA